MINVVFESTFDDNKKVRGSIKFASEGTDLIECMKRLDPEIEDLRKFMFRNGPRLIRFDVIEMQFV